jgi:Cu2+-exporting ATPase
MINHVVFDKTGTLTCGKLSLGNITLHSDLSHTEVLTLAANLEQGSLHPIAQVFLPYADNNIKVSEIHHHVGLGVEGTYNNQSILLGSKAFCCATVIDSVTTVIEKQMIYVSLNNHLVASIELNDDIRQDASDTINALKKANINISMATGDSSGHVNYLANKLAIDNVHSGMSPSSKLALINKLQQSQHVAMFGDGINDAPVLAGADISIAMGSGSAIAKNSADLILLGDHLSRFNDAIKVAKQTNRIIKQNLAWAFGYNVIILPLAVTGHVVPYIAAIGMSLSSIIVVSNSLRLLRLKL